jgi:hypothetical protein
VTASEAQTEPTREPRRGRKRRRGRPRSVSTRCSMGCCVMTSLAALHRSPGRLRQRTGTSMRREGNWLCFAKTVRRHSSKPRATVPDRRSRVSRPSPPSPIRRRSFIRTSIPRGTLPRHEGLPTFGLDLLVRHLGQIVIFDPTILNEQSPLSLPPILRAAAKQMTHRDVVPPLFKLESRRSRRRDSSERERTKGAAAAAMSLIMDAGLGRKEAARRVAEELRRGGVKLGGRRQLDGGTVASWRDQAKVAGRATSHRCSATVFPPPASAHKRNPACRNGHPTSRPMSSPSERR